MIRLKPIPKPTELTPEKKKELTSQYIKNGSSVWKQSYIKDALLMMSHNKCCYCECKLMEESKYFEVEHFYPKSIYPRKVVEWENLLPSCKRCNGKKGDHDTGKEPIIHPGKDDPRKHLVFRIYQIRAKNNSKIGENTVGVLDLNNTHRLTYKRFEIGEKLIQALKNLSEKCTEYFNRGKHSVALKNNLYSSLESLMREGIPSSEYSATSAAIILNEEYYTSIKANFKKYGLWDNTLKKLEEEVKNCALDIQ